MSNKGSGLFTWSEFKNRGVIKLAPDMLVYIGGNMEMQVIAPVNSKASNLSFNDGITTVSVQDVSETPGASTATIEIVAPVYGPKSNYWVPFQTDMGYNTRTPVFVPMQEVKIFFKGRFMVNDSPKYYPAFWGLITSVDETYNGGVHKITLQCADILHWWSYLTVTVHPVPESNVASGGQQNLTVFSTIFDTANPFDIIYQLFLGLGMHEFVTPTWVAQLTPLQTIYPPDQFVKVASGIMTYWQTRFGNMAGLLKMYGMLGEREAGKALAQINPSGPQPPAKTTGKSRSQDATAPQNTRHWPISDLMKRFTVFFEYDKMGTFQQAETMTKLEIATEVKNRSDFEFFQDVNGNFIFKPPFYNMDVRGIQPYEIEPYDIISSSFNLDTEGIVTAVQVNTAFDEQVRTNTQAPGGRGYHIDIDLAAKYGFRFRQINVEYIQGSTLARQMAVAQMSLINNKTFTANVTVPGRPEVRLGFPMYIRHRDSMHYIKSITHSFDYGGSFTTTFALETERKKVYNFEGTKWKTGDNGLPVPLTGANGLGTVYRFSGEVTSTPKTNQVGPATESQKTPDQLKYQQLATSQGRISSTIQGRYAITDRFAPAEIAITGSTVPFTDEAGFRVVGGFPYGRGLNPLVIDDDSLKYTYDSQTSVVTNMNSGALTESAAMAGFQKLFSDNKEGIVPGYLTTTSIVAADSTNIPSTPILSQATSDFIDDPAQVGPSPFPRTASEVARLLATMRPDGYPQQNDTNLQIQGSGVKLVDQAGQVTPSTKRNGLPREV